jgi:hypothetical protein
MLNEEMLEIILKKVLEELSRKGIDVNSRKNQEEKLIKVSFLGKDNLLKDELKTYAKINDNIDFKTFFESLEKADSEKLVVSDLSIDELVDLSQGRKNIVTEFLLNSKEVFLVEEGLEYKRYQKPEALIKVYDGYLQNLKEFGVKVLKRVEISKMFTKREEFSISGVITKDKLQKLSAENQKIVVKKGSKITSLADEYIKSNNIQLEYE